MFSLPAGFGQIALTVCHSSLVLPMLRPVLTGVVVASRPTVLCTRPLTQVVIHPAPLTWPPLIPRLLLALLTNTCRWRLVSGTGTILSSFANPSSPFAALVQATVG